MSKPLFAGFRESARYHLSPAPKLFKAGDIVDPKDLPTPYRAERGPFTVFSYGNNVTIDPSEVPTTPGKVIGITQVKNGGSGHISVRWGKVGEKDSVVADYAFGPNPKVKG